MNTYKQYAASITGLDRKNFHGLQEARHSVTMKIRKISDGSIVTETIKNLGKAQVSFNNERNYTLFEWKFFKNHKKCRVALALRGNHGVLRLEERK